MSKFQKSFFKCPKCGTENGVTISPSDNKVSIICKKCGETFNVIGGEVTELEIDPKSNEDLKEKVEQVNNQVDVCNNIFIDPGFRFVTSISSSKLGPFTIHRFSIVYDNMVLTLSLLNLQDLIRIKNQLIDAKLNNQLYTIYGLPSPLVGSEYYEEVSKEDGMWSGIVHVIYKYDLKIS